MIRVDRGFEAALGAALGDDLESPVDASAPTYWSVNGDGSGDPGLPQGAQPLIAHVTAPPELSRSLAQIGVIASGDAHRLMRLLRPGQRLVTKEGAVYRWDGHVTGSEAPGAAALRLSQKNRLSELEAEIDEARIVLSETEVALASTASEITSAERRLTDARDRARIAARQLSEARDALAAAERAAGDLMRRRDVTGEAVNQVSAQIEDLGVQEENARIELDDAPDISHLDTRLRDQQAVVATDRGLLAEARARYEGLSRETEARKRRLAAIAQERASWTARAASAANQIESLREREEEAREEIADLEAAPEEFDDKRRALLTELQKAEEARRASADRLAEAETYQRDADRIAVVALSELAESREKRGRAEERLVSAAEKRHESEVRIRETLNVAPYEVLRLAGLKPDRRCRISARSSARSTACAWSGNASVPSTCAPTRSRRSSPTSSTT